jgi:hypothetical protein
MMLGCPDLFLPFEYTSQEMPSDSRVHAHMISVLYTTASRHVYTFLEDDCTSYASSFIEIRYEFSIILFSNAKDEAWSQHRYLHGLGYLKNTMISLRRL